MLSLLTNLSPSTYTHRSYIISSGDDFSAQKAEEFEASLAKKQDTESRTMGSGRSHGAAAVGKDDEERNADGEQREEKKPYSIHTIPRARQIHQPLPTLPLTLPPSFLSSLSLLAHHPPTLILTNGPGTALLLLLASLLLRYFSFLPPLSQHGRTRSIYIESWARVRRPSLTGRIVVWGGLCDRVVVQWRGLERGGWGEFRGVLVR